MHDIVSIGTSGIRIAYERFGDPEAPPVLLVMGIGSQMLAWPEGFCEELVARGLQPIRFDNRDVGLSTHLHDAPMPDFAAALAGDVSSSSYTLSDMASDAVGLLDALGLASAHVVGASMGGMIAQTMAIEFPTRVRSLTSMMSTTGDPSVGRMHPSAMAAMGGPPPTTREEAIEQRVAVLRMAASPGFAFDEAAARDRSARAYDRSHDPVGVMRQAVAVLASGDRTQRLHGVRVPTLVVHGTADPMFDQSGGRATAAAIPGADLWIVEGLAHDLPRELWPAFADRIAALAHTADASAA